MIPSAGDGRTWGRGQHSAMIVLLGSLAAVFFGMGDLLGGVAIRRSGRPGAAISIALTGATCRTVYTAGRTVQAALQGREKPWSALVAGALPMVGNLAYPLQIAYCGTDRDHELARFILYDTFARFGQKVPIWGGCVERCTR